MADKLQHKDHLIKVPLDHHAKQSTSIELFAREVFTAKKKDAPIMVYLQGGPGHAAFRDFQNMAFVKSLAKKFRVLLLDQRGTGRSQPIGPETCSQFKTDKKLAQYLSYFRADQIILDCEYLRKKIFKEKKWSLFGQSYGGFLAFHYVSHHPKSLERVFMTGGIPPMHSKDVSKMYQPLVAKLAEFNKRYYKKFPQDKAAVQQIIKLLKKKPYDLDNGNTLTAERFLDIGIHLGFESGFAAIHALIDQAFTDSKQTTLRWAFAKGAIAMLDHEGHPLYAVLHESIYANGFASRWGADKAYAKSKTFQGKQGKIYFHGETIRRNAFKDYCMLKPFKKAADILAKKQWPKLYDMKQLKKNKVPVFCLQYAEDMYVNSKLCDKALKGIPKVKVWHHKEWLHDALRHHGEEIVKGFFKRAKL